MQPFVADGMEENLRNNWGWEVFISSEEVKAKESLKYEASKILINS